MSFKDDLERLIKKDDDREAIIVALKKSLVSQVGLTLSAEGDVLLTQEYAELISEARAGKAAAEEARDASERTLAQVRAEHKQEREDDAKERDQERKEQAAELEAERKEREEMRKANAALSQRLDAMQAKQAEILAFAKQNPKMGLPAPVIIPAQPRSFKIEATRGADGLLKFPITVKPS